MPQKPVPSLPPELVVAEWVIRHMPSLNSIPEAELWKRVDWTDPTSKEIFNEHRDAALERLSQEGYLQLRPGLGPAASYGFILTLTNEGRKIKKERSYLTAAEVKEIKDAFQADVTRADGKKKLWDNSSKYAIFSFSVLSALLTLVTLWEKCSPHSKAVDPTAQHAAAPDSTANKANTPSKKDLASLTAKKHHPRSQTSNPSGPSTTASSREAATNDEPKQQSALPGPPPPAAPLRIANAENIEFKLIKATGSASGQTITLTLLLTTSAANWEIWSWVHSVFDPDGNEYLLKSYRFGATSSVTQIPVNTGVPIKCSFTFGGILPAVRTIKLFSFKYSHKNGGSFAVEFRDIPVEWN